ncbi:MULTISPECIES: hypothetical protein [Nocardia]|uniref:hypothetical protein n=1 Tax=Nocardia TaxID=1817 RepID=UPI0007EAA75A|nr:MULTISPECIES: hypothetical protein [Nocardia]OBF65232.1 hypothetical protein A9X06_08135 [Mycobacterium sp. 852002-51759_SCH5129042]MBF6274511.1 hypothetical protein [Nocardia nova]MBV7705061.1 hypothetical protein [Nocardia nova]OBA49154.1 hypothetical protein A5789_32755 [Nocardia sp. 852002-51101_SCH5132738]OBB42224.1 hypothetical protein A5748_29970 [Nocardia sp. 852002-51244_SCH5132740]
MPIVFETGGLQQLDQTTWGNPATRDIITLSYIDLVPDLPAPLADIDTLRRRLTELQAEFGCLIEAHAITVDSQPALLRLEKFPLADPASGLGFTAGIVVPKAGCSAIVKIMCPETGRSGVREAAVVPKVGFANMFPPHPYAPEVKGKLPYNIADDARWDPQFPDHPLTRARRWITHVSRTARIDPRFAALPPFAGPAGAEASSGKAAPTGKTPPTGKAESAAAPAAPVAKPDPGKTTPIPAQNSVSDGKATVAPPPLPRAARANAATASR